MKNRIPVYSTIILGLLGFLSCASPEAERYFVVTDVTHFEIRGNGEELNFPVFARTMAVEDIVHDVDLAEYYYDKLSALYDFKSFTLVDNTSSEDLLQEFRNPRDPKALYTYKDSLAEVDIFMTAFQKNSAEFRFRTIDGRTGEMRDHPVEVPSGQSASVGTLYDREKNRGYLVSIRVLSIQVNDALTPEVFAGFLKSRKAIQGGSESERYDAKDQKWMDELFGAGVYDLPLETSSPKKGRADTLIDWDTPPEPVGGYARLREVVQYPKTALKDSLEGNVLVKVYIQKDGQVGGCTIADGIREDLDSAAVRALKSIEFVPATYQGEPVAVWVMIPISFKLKN